MSHIFLCGVLEMSNNLITRNNFLSLGYHVSQLILSWSVCLALFGGNMKRME
jgi:hypothetical protein